MRTVIVTGANGFIGWHLVNRLLANGFLVIGVTRKKPSFNSTHYIPIYADIRNKYEVENIFKKSDQIEGIIHLAADIDFVGSSSMIETNCIGTYHLSYYAVEYKLKYFINISSIPVIGLPLQLPITEEHPVNPGTLYHITKLAGEQIVEKSCSAYMNVLNLRISSPIGYGMNQSRYLYQILEKCRKNEKIEIYGQGLRLQNYIDVRDVVQAIICGILSEKKGLYLIAGAKGIRNIDLAKMCVELTNSNSQIEAGKKEDREENYCWDISTEKAHNELQYTPLYNIEETILWIFDKMKEE